MTLQVTEFARWQLRLTLQDLKRKPGNRHIELERQVRDVLLGLNILDKRATPISGLSELPYREVVIGSYHLFFRTVEDTLWLVGLWPPLYPE